MISINAVHFECKFEIGEWFVIGVAYNCEPKVTSSPSGTYLDSVSGVHLEGKNNFDVRTLDVRSQRLSNIPFNLADYFPNLEGIQWHSSNLQFISLSDLKPFPNLKLFSSHSNPLIVLDGDLFMGTPKIQWLSFYNNTIESVGYRLISSLYSLAYANFQSNACINRVMTHPAMMGELIQELKEKCPSPTDPVECEHRCSLNEEVDEVYQRLDDQKERIFELNQEVESNQKRIEELERIVKDLSAVLKR